MTTIVPPLDVTLPATPSDLRALFEGLKSHCQNRHRDTAKAGFGGSWTAEENRGDEHLRFVMSDGGYNQYLISLSFGFRLREGFTHARGNFVDLEQGRLEQVQACHRALGLSVTPASTITQSTIVPSSEKDALLATFEHTSPAPLPRKPASL